MANTGPYLFKLSFSQPLTAPLILFIENEHLDTISLYQLKGDQLVLLQRKGNDFPKEANRFGCPDFSLSPGQSEYYLLTTFKKDVSLPLTIGTAEQFNRWSTNTFFFLGLYYGVSLMFLTLNLSLFLYLKDRLFLYYALFLVFIAASIAYADGLFRFLTSSSWLLNHADVMLHLGMAFSCTLFARRFLGLNARKVTLTSLILLALAVLAYLTSLAIDSYRLFLVGEGAVIGLLCFFWILALGQLKGAAHSRFFVLGYGLFLFCAIDYFLLRKVGIFTFDLYSGQLKTGGAIELVVLTLAIMYRIRALDRQNRHYRGQIEQHIRSIHAYQQQTLQQQDHFFTDIQQKYDLSERELEVLRGITEGLTNTQIAERIFLSVNTVKFHTRNIFDKLQITNRTQALGKVYADRYR